MNTNGIHAICTITLGVIAGGCQEHHHHVTTTTKTSHVSPDSDYRGVSMAAPAYQAPAPSYQATAWHDGGNITLEEFGKHLKNDSAVIVDARRPTKFAQGHVRGAINIHAGQEEVSMPQFTRDVPNDRLIIVYCSGPDCDEGDNVRDYLMGRGFRNVRVFHPGWETLESRKDFQ